MAEISKRVKDLINQLEAKGQVVEPPKHAHQEVSVPETFTDVYVEPEGEETIDWDTNTSQHIVEGEVVTLGRDGGSVEETRDTDWDRDNPADEYK